MSPTAAPPSEALPNTAVVIFARMDSRRLPGKVLTDIAGQPLLARTLGRCRQACASHPPIIATSDRPVDDPIAQFAEKTGTALFRGDVNDVLGRALACAHAHGVEHLIRISADSPFVAPTVIDATIALHTAPASRDGQPDITTNVFPRTYPPGTSVEIIPRGTLEQLNRDVTEPADREHVTRYLYAHPEAFRIQNLTNPDPSEGSVNLTVDTKEDLERARWIAARLDAPDTAPLAVISGLAAEYDRGVR